MKSYYGNVVLVTGASSGIGQAIAVKLARQGCRVYGTSRRAVDGTVILNDLSSGFFKLIKLDVCDDESVEMAVQYVLDAEGRIDVLINNAGIVVAGAIEETSPKEALMQFDTNFFGMHRVCRKVMPVMRSQKRGLIINIGSVAGIITVPYHPMYSACKYAVEAFTEALRMETKDFGVKAVVIEPGDIKTDLTSNRYFCEEAKESKYPRSKASIEKMMKDEQNGGSPDQIANIVIRLMGMKNPPVRVTAGFVYKFFAILKRVLPSRVVEYIVGNMY